MNTVTVTASGAYEVLIGSGLLPSLGSRLRTLSGASRITLVSDSHVFPLWGEAALDSLTRAGYTVSTFVFPAGEESKNANTYLDLLNHMARNHMTRTDLVLALGGGVVGDLTGFAAATYLRGIDFVQVPTTLLAAVDSSVGGKTAIDLPAGKNLAGAFCQPRLVLCDLDTLNTLPTDIFRDGCAEVIKTAILFDPELFSHLRQRGLDFDRDYVITRCVECKRDVVEQDEFDRGQRMLLNLGHTLGHGIEAASGYTVSHGKAVAVGTALAASLARDQGLCTPETCHSIRSLLASFGLPITTEFSPEILAEYALSDKKRSGDTIRLILPRAIGSCEILPTPVSRLIPLIKAGITYGSTAETP